MSEASEDPIPVRQTKRKPLVQVTLKFKELSVTVGVASVSVQTNCIAFKYDPDVIKIIPEITGELDLIVHGITYRVMWVGGYMEFDDTGEHMVSFMRVPEKGRDGEAG